MSEETWYKMLAVSFALHILFVAAVSIPFKSTKRKIDLSSSYSVNLVGGVGDTDTGRKEAAVATKTIPGKPIPVVKEQKPVPAKNKPIPIKKEDLVSLSKKKVTEKAGTTEEEIDQLQKKIQNLRKKTEYLDVAKSARSGTATSGGTSGAGGFLGSGEGAGGIVDPLMQKYHMDILEKIKEVWRMPASSKKDWETIMVIKIRRDGIVVDINPEKTSGNRLYDESIRRAIKAAEPLPRIPATIKEDSLELGFRFRPEDM
jgi:colicin import membrane protein